MEPPSASWQTNGPEEVSLYGPEITDAVATEMQYRPFDASTAS